MKRRMVFALLLALMSSLAAFAVTQAASLYATRVAVNGGLVIGENEVLGPPDGRYAAFDPVMGAEIALDAGEVTSGGLCVYGPAGYSGGAGAYIPNGYAIGFFGPSNYAGGRYKVRLFTKDDTGAYTIPYTGNYQFLIVANVSGFDTSGDPIYVPLSVDAVKANCGMGHNGKEQND